MDNIPTNETTQAQSKDSSTMSSEICYNAALEEYSHTIQRASKFENKIYILITFCSLYSSFILSIFDDFFKLKFPIVITVNNLSAKLKHD